MPDRPRLAENLRKARRRKDLTQEQAAQAIGVHEMTVSRWERGTADPDDDQLEKASSVYGFEIPVLRYGDVDNPTAAPTAGDGPEPTEAATQAERVLRSHAVRVWLAEFRSELTRAHATEEEVERALALVSRPEVLTFYSRGRVRALNESDAITALEAIAIVVRAELQKRGRKFA